MDDINFYPCTCGYQICRFCWHRIRTDENGLCPACRKAYQECPADFKPLSEEELQRIKNEKKQKDQQRKQKISENRKHLASVRVVQKNLVFVVGLSQRLADQEVLKKQEYFGKFGKIVKVVINQNTSYAGSQVSGPSASAYVTYHRAEDALRAIQAVNNVHVDGRTLKASLGTTKYCSHFLKNAACPKPDCMYLHELGDEAASFTKEDMQMGKHQEYEQRLLHDLFGGGSSSSTTSQQHSPTVVTTTTSSSSSSTSSSSSAINNQAAILLQQQLEAERNRMSPTTTSTTSTTVTSNKSPSPPITTNHNNADAWPSLQRDSNSSSSSNSDEKSQSPTIDSTTATPPPPVMNHTGPPPGVTRPPHINHHIEEALVAGIPLPLAAELQAVIAGISPATSNSQSPSLPSELSGPGTPSPDSTTETLKYPDFQNFCRELCSVNFNKQGQPTSRSPFESHENSSFFSANGFLPQMLQLGLGGPPPLIPPGPPNLPPPQPHPPNDWSEGLVLSNDLPPVNHQTDWQAAFGFGSEIVKEKHNAEDDLGFDPWNESSKGLADLLEKELQLGTLPTTNSSNVQVTQPPPGFNPSPFNPNGFGIRPPAHQLPPEAGGSKMFQWMQNKPPRLPPPTHPMSSMPPPFYPPGHHPPLPPGSAPLGFPNHNPRVPPPLGIPDPSGEPVNLESWQEGLRALLPNINISFGVPPSCIPQHIPTSTNTDTWPGTVSPSSWSKHDPAIISINSSNSLNTANPTTGAATTTGSSVGGGTGAGGLLDKDGEEPPPHWLESLQSLTEPDHESPTHSNHLFPSHQHNNRGPSWTTHAPPPGLHPQMRPNSQTTEPHTLTENL